MARIHVKDFDVSDGAAILSLSVDPAVAQGAPADAVLRLRWTFRAAPDGEGAVRAGDLRKARAGVFRVRVAMPPRDAPLTGLFLDPARPGDAVLFEKDLDRRLARLYPADPAAYVELMQSATRRWGHLRTRYFLAAQVAAFFEEHPGHRAGAALVMAYKAVELGEEGPLARAAETVERAFGWLEGMPVDWHPRVNREHLEISLLTVRWHVELARGDAGAARRTLLLFRERCRNRSNYATLAYPATKSLLLAGWLEHRCGERARAAECWNGVIDLFKMAVRDADPGRAVLFGELGHSFEAASLSAHCLRAARSNGRFPMPGLEEVTDRALRVAGKARDRLRACLDAYLADNAANAGSGC